MGYSAVLMLGHIVYKLFALLRNIKIIHFHILTEITAPSTLIELFLNVKKTVRPV